MSKTLAAAWADFRCIFEKDPAARNWLEVVFCYPGMHALVLHRIAHRLYLWGIPLIPRLISYGSRFITGVDIHPGAQIGKGVFIDHGMGVVIGETAIIGDSCLIYQESAPNACFATCQPLSVNVGVCVCISAEFRINTIACISDTVCHRYFAIVLA